MDSSGVIAPIQRNTLKLKTQRVLLLFQVPQYLQAFPLIGGIHIYACDDAIFSVYRGFKQISNPFFAWLADIPTVWIGGAGELFLYNNSFRRFF